MAFVVEDGSALEDANSYISVQFFKDFHGDRGRDVSAFTDTEIEGGSVQATDYVEKRYGIRFRGWKRSKRQALEWPRINAFDNDDYTFDSNEVPAQLQKGVAEYALLALQLGRDLAPPPTPKFSILNPETGTNTTGEGVLSKKREKVGPIEEETQFSTDETIAEGTIGPANPFTAHIPEYPQADLWIHEIIQSTVSRELVRG